MNSNRFGLISSVVGAVVGATFTYFMISKVPQNGIDGEQAQMNELLQRMDKTDAMLHKIETVMLSSQEMQQKVVYSTLYEQPAKQANDDSVAIASNNQETMDLPDVALEEAIVQNITTRLYDPVYMQSATLAEVMQSEEMLNLSDQARERVVVEMVGMLNRGEIDAGTFLALQEQVNR